MQYILHRREIIIDLNHDCKEDQYMRLEKLLTYCTSSRHIKGHSWGLNTQLCNTFYRGGREVIIIGLKNTC